MKGETMKILESALPQDWERVNVLASQVSALHAAMCPNAFSFEEAPFQKEFFLEKVQAKELYVARKNGVIVGYVLFYVWEANGGAGTKRKMLSIDDICVEEALRNQGIGQQMMEDVRELAKELECTDLQLFVIVQNENAIAFYKKCGFHISNLGMQMKL